MKTTLFIFLFLIPTLAFGQQRVFVAVDGSPKGDGSIAKPYDITTAFRSLNNGGTVYPGDTIFMRAGIYEQCGASINCSGTIDAPIVIMPYNHETVIIRGNCSEIEEGLITLNLHAEYVYVHDLIITQAPHGRLSSQSTSWPTDIVTEIGVVVGYEGSKLINCIIHNVVSSGISSPNTAVGAEMYGNIVLYSGWHESSSTREKGHGHGLYFQNEDSRKLIWDNVFCKTYGNGIQFYSAGGSELDGCTVYRNIVIMGSSINSSDGMGGSYNYLISSGGSSNGMVIMDNHSYHKGTGTCFSVGYTDISDTCYFANNYAMGGDKGFYYWNYRKVISRNNTIVMKNLRLDGYDHEISIIDNPEDVPGIQHDIDNNIYYTDNAVFTPGKNFADWKTINNIDNSSTCNYVTDFTSIPNSVYIYPNKYEKKRANIVIYNHKLLNKVEVDLSSVLEVGDEYYIYDIEDLRQPVIHNVYDGNPVGIPTDQTSLFPLIGTELYAQPAHSGNDYGAFLLIGRKLDVLGDELPTGIPETKVDNNKLKIISVTSNKNDNSVIIKIDNSTNDNKVLIDVFNISGVNVIRSTKKAKNGINEYKLSLMNIKDNIYIISVTNNQGRDTKKFVCNIN